MPHKGAKVKKTKTKWSKSGSSNEVIETQKITASSKTTVSSASKVSSGVITKEITSSDNKRNILEDKSLDQQKQVMTEKNLSSATAAAGESVVAAGSSSSDSSGAKLSGGAKAAKATSSNNPTKKEEKCICEICTCGRHKCKHRASSGVVSESAIQSTENTQKFESHSIEQSTSNMQVTELSSNNISQNVTMMSAAGVSETSANGNMSGVLAGSNSEILSNEGGNTQKLKRKLVGSKWVTVLEEGSTSQISNGLSSSDKKVSIGSMGAKVIEPHNSNAGSLLALTSEADREVAAITTGAYMSDMQSHITNSQKQESSSIVQSSYSSNKQQQAQISSQHSTFDIGSSSSMTNQTQNTEIKDVREAASIRRENERLQRRSSVERHLTGVSKGMEQAVSFYYQFNSDKVIFSYNLGEGIKGYCFLHTVIL
nr:uncharacterized protein LOC121116872 [Lepeophtheirus salmonis]